MEPVPPPGQARQAVEVLHGVLGGALAGAYLHGSAVLGGLGPHSDIDVFAVVDRPTTRPERRALVAGLMPLSGTPARPVEVTVVAAAHARPWRYPPLQEFQYGEWLRADYERGHVPDPRPDPDLAPLTALVLSHGRPLHGPPPAALLDPVPRADLRRALAAGVPDLLADLEEDTRNAVLTLARVWTTLATGEIRSKDGAAAWALERLPARHRPVLARARAAYRGEHPDHWADLAPALRPYADHLAGVIADLAPAGTGAPGT
ncbi:DUF4111 domain-containing protein [Streptomonospora sp. S1-112]|uniref:DUF4111 domain-containing protein n=1 Tax=Streptomonospora mangrovi TaxID=2883123 RepID=A0A9X3NKB8_9ACTN|nr:aminoglycoside adenylyltransferase family protein [Streptomonospora mangrovi]MDA0563379.1 DUF4111 domain-containing protein [Streptomonospora mangrovi]